MMRNVKVTVLTLAMIGLAGCAHSDRRTSLIEKPKWTKSSKDRASAKVLDIEDPKILPQTHFAAACLHEQQGLIGEAILQYRKAIALNHKYVQAYHRLGVLLSRVGMAAEATKPLEQAVELSPKDATLRNNLAYAFMLQGKWQEADRELKRATELEPSFAHAHINRGMVLCKLERFDEAFDSFHAVLPKPDAYYNIGLMLKGQRRFRDAAETFETVLALNSDFTAARKQLEEMAPHLESMEPVLPAGAPAVKRARDEPAKPADPVKLPITLGERRRPLKTSQASHARAAEVFNGQKPTTTSSLDHGIQSREARPPEQVTTMTLVGATGDDLPEMASPVTVASEVDESWFEEEEEPCEDEDELYVFDTGEFGSPEDAMESEQWAVWEEVQPASAFAVEPAKTLPEPRQDRRANERQAADTTTARMTMVSVEPEAPAKTTRMADTPAPRTDAVDWGQAVTTVGEMLRPVLEADETASRIRPQDERTSAVIAMPSCPSPSGPPLPERTGTMEFVTSKTSLDLEQPEVIEARVTPMPAAPVDWQARMRSLNAELSYIRTEIGCWEETLAEMEMVQRAGTDIVDATDADGSFWFASGDPVETMSMTATDEKVNKPKLVAPRMKTKADRNTEKRQRETMSMTVVPIKMKKCDDPAPAKKGDATPPSKLQENKPRRDDRLGDQEDSSRAGQAMLPWNLTTDELSDVLSITANEVICWEELEFERATAKPEKKSTPPSTAMTPVALGSRDVIQMVPVKPKPTDKVKDKAAPRR
jgi:Tfp pilus assembly protein PilF